MTANDQAQQDKRHERELHKKGIYVFPLIFGIFFAFGGLVFPGWLWSVNTPGPIDPLSLRMVKIIGGIGVALIIFSGPAYLWYKTRPTTES
jgi:hypothetical protein